jgi:hypothetical protein
MGSSNLPLTEDNYEAFVNSFELNNLVGKKAETDKNNLFGMYWNEINLNLKNF